VKFGISFTTALLNQGSALIWVYIDGSVSVTTGGVEMGQEVNTKIAIVVAEVLGISIDKIKVESSNTQRVGNASPTAASTGTDINANAARVAAEQIRDMLKKLAAELILVNAKQPVKPSDIVMADDVAYVKAKPGTFISFKELVRHAYNNRIALGAHGYYATPEVHFDRDKGKGHPFAYYVYGCALVRMQIDTLTGDNTIIDTFIVHETGPSLHKDIDRGQIIGAFIQAMGWCTMEDMPYDNQGRYMALSPSTYKIPGIRDLPQRLMVELVQTPCKQASVMGSKAVGEPPFIYGEAVWFAIKHAIEAVKPDANVELAFPATPEQILMAIARLTK
jgi:xanthine dehydrogenase large subunit